MFREVRIIHSHLDFCSKMGDVSNKRPSASTKIVRNEKTVQRQLESRNVSCVAVSCYLTLGKDAVDVFYNTQYNVLPHL